MMSSGLRQVIFVGVMQRSLAVFPQRDVRRRSLVDKHRYYMVLIDLVRWDLRIPCMWAL